MKRTGMEDREEKNMEYRFSRTEMLFGKDAMEKLKNARVAVFGIGGVGGYVVEALARSGVGAFDLIDNDTVCLSNLNRQMIATECTLDQYKVDVMKERILSINPEAHIKTYKCFYLPETAGEFAFANYSYVVDAIDTVTGKIQLVLQAKEAGVPIISSMGTGNKINPMELEIADLYQTSVCPLAKVMRRELKKRGVDRLKVLYSKEKPLTPMWREEQGVDEKNAVENVMAEKKMSTRRAIPGSTSFVPSVAGLIIASEVIKDLTGIRNG